MDITPLIPEGRKIITAYGMEGFTISREHYAGSVLVFPHKVISWPVCVWDNHSLNSLKSLLKDEEPIEILLIGGGNTHLQLGLEARQQLKQQGIAFDSMSTGAACRTYNVLLSEGRSVAAALILPKV